MIVWVIAGVLALATGFRIGWALVNRQSVISSAMIVALAGMTVLAALHWPPLTALVDNGFGRPGVSVVLQQVALVVSAAGSCVMITSVSSRRGAVSTRRLAALQYSLAAVIAGVIVARFLTAGAAVTSRNWLPAAMYVLLAMSLVSWVGLRLSAPTRRGRAVALFSTGAALIVAVSAFVLIRAVSDADSAGVGVAATLLLAALAVIGAGALSPMVEDWFGARRELALIAPLEAEMDRRHPDVGIGVRPRGPLVFRVAERLSQISDALYLEAMRAQNVGSTAPPAGVSAENQARRVAQWLIGNAEGAEFPGRNWLRQPAGCSDRDWILKIARQYRSLQADAPQQAGAARNVAALPGEPAAG